MNTSTLPQDLMSCSLLHFENMVPIDDLKLRNDQKRRLLRVSHVYWQWSKNPFTCDYKAMLRQLVKQMGGFQGASTECRAWQKDVQLFEFVKESISPITRREAEVKAKVAIDKLMRIGMETDNVQALDKGTKHIIELAGLNKPEQEQADMSKMMFIPPVITTSAHEVDDTKEDMTDKQALAIMNKYGAHIDEKRKAVEERVDAMMARRDANRLANENANDDEQNRDEYQSEQ